MTLFLHQARQVTDLLAPILTIDDIVALADDLERIMQTSARMLHDGVLPEARARHFLGILQAQACGNCKKCPERMPIANGLSGHMVPVSFSPLIHWRLCIYHPCCA